MNKTDAFLARNRRGSCSARIALVATLIVASIVYSLYLYAKADSRMMLVVALATTLCASGFATLVLFDPNALVRRHPVRCFGAALAAVCVVFAFALTPFSMPDEHRHYFASYWMSDCLMGSASFVGGEPYPMRACDYEFSTGKDDISLIENESYHWVAEHATLFDTDGGIVEYKDRLFTLAGDPPQSRIGSVVGLTLGRLLNLGAVPTFYLGRLGAAAVFVLAAMWAVKVTPLGQRMLMGISLLPITVSLAASFSYDSGIISLSLLAFAYLMRAVYGSEQLGRRDVIATCVLAALLTPCKVVYAVVFGCALLVPSHRFKSARRAWAFRIGVVAVALGVFVLTRLTSVLALAGTTDGGLSQRGGEVGRMYTLGVLLDDPIGAVLLFLRSFDVMGGTLWGHTFGSNLGSLQYELLAPSWVYGTFFVLVLAASVRSDDDDTPVPVSHAVFMAFLALCAMLAIWLSMCLGWTFVTENVIQGMQGRYFLPLLPLLFVSARCTSFRWAKAGSAVTLVSVMAWLNVSYIMWIMATGLTL